jgi:hypothetical protein
VAERTKHGHLVEKYSESSDYYPVGVEGMILTYVDILVNNNGNHSVESRISEIENYINRSSFTDSEKSSFLENFKKAIPRYTRYEKIIKSMM